MRALVAVLTLAMAAPVAAHPCPPAKPAPAKPANAAPTAEQVMRLYQRTATTLRAAQNADAAAAQPLFVRFRYINVNDAIRTPDKRTAAVLVLEKIAADAKKIAP